MWPVKEVRPDERFLSLAQIDKRSFRPSDAHNSVCTVNLYTVSVADPRGDWGYRPSKTYENNLFTMILHNSENSIRDIKLFCRPLFCHSRVVKHTSSLHLPCGSEPVMVLDYQILLKSPP